MAPIRTLLAIDPGTKVTGWAIVRAGNVLAWGCWTFTRWDAAVILPSLVIAKAHEYSATELAYEQVGHHMSAAAAHAYGSNRACIMQAGNVLGLEPHPVDAATAKKRATGSGKAKKPQMVMAANNLLGDRGPVREEDAADVIWVGITAWEQRCSN